MDLIHFEFDALHDDLEIVEIVEQGFLRRVYERHSYFNELDELPKVSINKTQCLAFTAIDRKPTRISVGSVSIYVNENEVLFKKKTIVHIEKVYRKVRDGICLSLMDNPQ